VRRVAVLGRGGAGKSVLARRLADVTGLPRTELDAIFWQPGPQGPRAPDPAEWRARLTELAQRDAWIIDGDLGPYDDMLPVRLRAADTIIVLDFPLWRCAWRSLRRGRERSDYWRWVRAYRRRYLPAITASIARHAPHADVRVLHTPGSVSRFLASAAK
jgi:adenylate kinase family enzyme